MILEKFILEKSASKASLKALIISSCLTEPFAFIKFTESSQLEFFDFMLISSTSMFIRDKQPVKLLLLMGKSFGKNFNLI